MRRFIPPLSTSCDARLAISPRASPTSLPSTAWRSWIRWALTKDELAESCKEINRFAERLSKIPVDARSLLALIVVRGEKVGGHFAMSRWSGEFAIPVRVLKSLVDCTAVQLRQHVEVLEHFELLHREDEPFDSPPRYIAGNSTQDIGWPLLQDIRDFADTDLATIRRILCDLDFTTLDRD